MSDVASADCKMIRRADLRRSTLIVRAFRSMGRLGNIALLLLLLGGVASAIPEPLGVLAELAMQTDGGPVTIIAASMLALVLLTAACAVGRRRTPFAPWRFLLLTTVGALFLHAALIHFVDPKWGGDYLRYWARALRMANGPFEVDNIYRQRALPIAFPVALAFGDSHLALKVINAIILTATGLIGYDILRLSRSHQAAQAFCLLFFLAPVPAFTTLIPSHDLWGIFFIALALWLVTRGAFRNGRGRWHVTIVLGYAVAASLAIELLELQRGLGLFMIASLMAAALLEMLCCAGEARGSKASMHARAFMAMSLICVVLFLPIGRLVDGLGLTRDRSEAERAVLYMKFAAHSGTMSSGTSSWYARFNQRFSAKLEEGPEATRDFARSIALSSWTLPPLDKLGHVAHQAPRLFDLGYPSDWDTTLHSPKHLPRGIRTFLIALADAFGTLFAVMLCWALLRTCMPGRRTPVTVTAPLALSLAIAAAMLILFENKAPNLTPIWLGSSMFLGWAFSARSTHIQRQGVRGYMTGGLRIAGALTLMGAVVVAMSGLITVFFGPEQGRILDHWRITYRPASASDRTHAPTLAEDIDANEDIQAFEVRQYPEGSLKSFVRRGAPLDAARIARYASGVYTVLELPRPPNSGDRIGMQRKVCAGVGKRHALEFFLFSAYQRQDRPDSFRVNVRIDGHQEEQLEVPSLNGNMRLVRIDDAFDTPSCKRISIDVESQVTQAAASWRRASHVEIWFPRLVR